jgi:hypothetical protein
MLDNMSSDDDNKELANKFNNNVKINEPVANLLDFDGENKTEYQKQTSTNSAFDLLVDFESSTSNNNQQVPVNNNGFANFDLFNSTTETTTKPSSNLVDFSNNNDLFSFDSLASNLPKQATQEVPINNNLFDSFNAFNNPPVIAPTPVGAASNIKQNLSQSDLLKQQKPNSFLNDPFSLLDNFGSKPQFKQQTSAPNTLNLNQTKAAAASSGNNNLFASKQTSPQDSPLHKVNYTIGANTFTTKPAVATNGSNTNLNAKPKPAPVVNNTFNFSNFSKTAPPANSNSNNNNVFDEFLPGEFLKNTKAANMTLKDIKRETNVKDTDPDKLRVADWTDGKKKNIRALLCSMDKVLWDGEIKWKQVGMHELLTADQVKKAFRRAVLVVHPDKVSFIFC